MGLFGTKVVIPGPSGPHAVGLCSFEVSDPSHLETLGPAAAPRRIPVLAWYPALPTDAARLPALDEPLRAALAKQVRLPKFLIPRGNSHAVRDAPAATGRWPALLFNHGLGSYQKQCRSLLEELASHGFVALSVGHPYESLVVEYRDGSTVPWRTDVPAWRAVESGLKDFEATLAQAAPLITRARQCTDAGALHEAMQAVAQLPSYAALPELVARWARDTRVVLDALPALDAGELAPPLRGLLDGARVGALGHSLGGMVAGALAMSEPRVRAGMNLDGAQLPLQDQPWQLRAPFCFVYADAAKAGKTVLANEGMNDALLNDAPAGSCGVCVAGSGHLNFTDMNNLALMAKALGRIDRGEMARTLRALVLGFFDHHLRGAPLQLGASTALRFTRAPTA